MELTLRKVVPEDVNLLYRWANDKAVRQNAFHTEPIPYAGHCAWFARMLADGNVLMYVLHDVDQNADLGQIRLAIEKTEALISYSIDAAARGQGLGTRMVLMAEEKLRNDRTDVTDCRAQVKYENPASARVFEKCGYDRQELEDYLEFTKKIKG